MRNVRNATSQFPPNACRKGHATKWGKVPMGIALQWTYESRNRHAKTTIHMAAPRRESESIKGVLIREKDERNPTSQFPPKSCRKRHATKSHWESHYNGHRRVETAMLKNRSTWRLHLENPNGKNVPPFPHLCTKHALTLSYFTRVRDSNSIY